MRPFLACYVTAALFFLAACETTPIPDKLTLIPTTFDAMPGWHHDDHHAALATLHTSCKKMATLPADRPHGNLPVPMTVGQWQDVCKQLPVSSSQARIFFETHFMPVKAANHTNTQGLFTGYYEPMLYGARARSGRYRYPIYGLPNDITDGEPYLDRKTIELHGLEGRAEPIAYVDDDVALFFLHIQGSGRIQLDDGSMMRVGYAGKNHHDYTPIGRILIDRGELTKENVSLFTIRHWLWNHPRQAKQLMQANASYVFFREIDGEGPIGGQGVVLVAERSLAIDKHLIPYGTPIYLDTTLPSPPMQTPTPFRRLMVAQDTGGAIRGPVRGDVFFGYGSRAEALAGHMKQPGEYYLLLPTTIARSL